MDKALTDRGPIEERYDEESFLKDCVKRFNRCVEAEQVNRSNAADDLRFKSGDQWPEYIKTTRTLEKRPCLTINKVKTFVHQITNDQRQNRPQINVSPLGDKSDPETAKMLKGLIRQIERQSNADIAYDTGFDNAVSNGWGYWRLITDYESQTSFDKVIRIVPIRNPFRVYLDPDHESPDGSDAEWGFISDLVPRKEFEDDWPDADPLAFQEGGMGDEYVHWSTQTHIRIAEYFYKEFETKTLIGLTTGQTGFDDDPEIKAVVEAFPESVVDEREVRAEKIKWCKITANQILEETEWVGKWIPIVKVIGDEVDIEGKHYLAGLVRDMKDPQRMYNFWCTSETELIALAPKAPWIMEEGQIENHDQMWKQANIKSLPYLLYKGTSIGGKPAPPPQRQQFVGPPTGVVNAKEGAAQDMQAVSGVRFDATLNERMHDESGKAIRELKRVSDLGNFHYVDNLSRSLRHTGRILIDLIPKVYDTKRVLTILREDDTEQNVVIDPNLQQPHQQTQVNGKVQRLYNPKLGDYEVAVTIGPSFATKRQEASESMISFLKTVPDVAPMVADLIAKNQDWPGSEEIASRLASQLPPGLMDKALEDLPPEAKGMIGSLKQQMQKLKQERDQAVAMLGDKDKDRALDQDKINKDFEAKMTAIAAGMQEAIMKFRDEDKQDNQAELQKISKDFEAKVIKALLDYNLGTLELEQDRELSEQEMEYGAVVEGAKLDSSERVSSQKLDSTERVEGQKLASGEKVEGQKLQSNEKVQGQKVRSGEKVAKIKSEEKSGESQVMETMTKLLEAVSKPKKKRLMKLADGLYESEEVVDPEDVKKEKEQEKLKSEKDAKSKEEDMKLASEFMKSLENIAKSVHKISTDVDKLSTKQETLETKIESVAKKVDEPVDVEVIRRPDKTGKMKVVGARRVRK